ncbi:MAG: hypothetical protein EON54_06540 [Alcaligenaceae bacterium]|nr:MAG: hypothetical protein EON54_06540 [Alcaligenaceae bacterium]
MKFITNEPAHPIELCRFAPFFTRDDMLAAARILDRNKGSIGNHTLRRRICDDGSLHVFDIARLAYGHLSLEEVNIAISELPLADQHLPLWQKILKIKW